MNLHKLLMTFLLLFMGTTMLGAVMTGGGGIVSTTLAANLTETATNISVTSTSLFADKDIIIIDSEKILYQDKDDNTDYLLECTRNYDGTGAVAHTAGTRVYTQESGMLNDVLGYNFVVEVETGGMWGLIMLPIRFFTTTLPHLIQVNVGFLKIPELSILGIVWIAAGIVLLVVLAIQIGPIAVSLVTGVIGLVRR